MGRIRSIVCLALLPGLVVVFGGCAGPEPRGTGRISEPARRETYTIRSPALVLGGAAEAQRRRLPYARPWWHSRNNAHLNVRPDGNVRAPTAYQIRIRDQQRSFSGRIHNHYEREVRSIQRGWVID